MLRRGGRGWSRFGRNPGGWTLRVEGVDLGLANELRSVSHHRGFPLVQPRTPNRKRVSRIGQAFSGRLSFASDGLVSCVTFFL